MSRENPFSLDSIMASLPEPGTYEGNADVNFIEGIEPQATGSGNIKKFMPTANNKYPKYNGTMTDGYIEVPKANWFTIPKGTSIRVVDVQNNLRPGGKLIDFTNGNIRLRKFLGKKTVFWSIKLQDVAKFFYFNDKQKNASGQPSLQFSIDNQHLSPQPIQGAGQPPLLEPTNQHEDIMLQMGSKLMAEDSVLKQRVDDLEKQVKLMNEDLTKFYKAVRRLYERLDAAGIS